MLKEEPFFERTQVCLIKGSTINTRTLKWEQRMKSQSRLKSTSITSPLWVLLLWGIRAAALQSSPLVLELMNCNSVSQWGGGEHMNHSSQVFVRSEKVELSCYLQLVEVTVMGKIIMTPWVHTILIFWGAHRESYQVLKLLLFFKNNIPSAFPHVNFLPELMYLGNSPICAGWQPHLKKKEKQKNLKVPVAMVMKHLQKHTQICVTWRLLAYSLPPHWC